MACHFYLGMRKRWRQGEKAEVFAAGDKDLTTESRPGEIRRFLASAAPESRNSRPGCVSVSGGWPLTGTN